MKVTFSTQEYLDDRVKRIMTSKTFTEVLGTASPEQVEEIRKTLDWHIARTLNDQKSQMKFVFRKKTPEIAETASLVVDHFSLRLLKYKALGGNDAVESKE